MNSNISIYFTQPPVYFEIECYFGKSLQNLPFRGIKITQHHLKTPSHREAFIGHLQDLPERQLWGFHPVAVGGPSHTTEPFKQVPHLFCHFVYHVFAWLKFSSPGRKKPARLGGDLH